MGGGGGQTVGYRYKIAYHMGLCYGPIDAFLQFRGGTKTAWSGNAVASGTITINQPNLWGGDKDQGGIVGDVDLCFGEPTQQPNAYIIGALSSSTINLADRSPLLAIIAAIAGAPVDGMGNLILPGNADAHVPAYRGLASVVFKGGVYGSMNPYPQKASYQICKIKKGWDGDTANDGSACWYSAKAAVPLSAAPVNMEGSGWAYQIENFSEPNTVWSNWTIPTTGWLQGGELPFSTGDSTWPAMRSNIWVQRTITALASGLTLNVAADNGCVVFADGAKVGASNPTNAVIGNNAQYPVKIPLTVGKTFVLTAKAYAEINASDDSGNVIGITVTGQSLYGMNPAHILYYARTQAHMGREPIASMNDASFRAAADWFFAQGFGLCAVYDASQESIDDFIARIEKAAGCAMSRDPVDGLWYIDVANGVYTLASLPIITDDDILEFTDQPLTFDSAVNSVSVTYTDPALKADVTTAPVQALGLINTFGTIHQSTDYKEIPTSALALRVAARDLQQTTTPTHGFELTVMPRAAYALRRGTYFRLQVPKRGIADMVCILGDIQRGTLASGAIQLTAVQDIYSLPATSYVTQQTGIQPGAAIPAAPTAPRAVETAYVDIVPRVTAQVLGTITDDEGFLTAMAADPGGMRDYEMTVSTHGAHDYVEVLEAPWSPSALIVEGDTLIGAVPATSFTLTGGSHLSDVTVGEIALWDNELVRVDAIDPVGGTLTVGRGVADTVPAAHAANSRILFYGAGAGYDQTTYTAGESLDVQLLTNTASAQIDPSLANTDTVTIIGRQALPYPPGKLRIGGAPYPASVSGSFAVTWTHRNRVTQADQLIDSEAADVTPADNTRYHLRFADSTGALLVDRLDIGPGSATVTLNYTGNVTMTLATIDDIGVSMQAHSVTFAYTPPGGSPPNAITATAYTPVYTGIIYDGGNAGT